MQLLDFCGIYSNMSEDVIQNSYFYGIFTKILRKNTKILEKLRNNGMILVEDVGGGKAYLRQLYAICKAVYQHS